MEDYFKNLRDRVNDRNYRGFCRKRKKFVSAGEMKKFCLNLGGRKICKNLKLRIKN